MCFKRFGVYIALVVLGTAAIAQTNNDQGLRKEVQDLEQKLATARARISALSTEVGALQSEVATQGSMIWVTADCNNGGSIAGALQSANYHAGPLGILVLGVCHESVSTSRSNTTISGGTLDAAINPLGPGTSAVDVSSAVNFAITNLALTGASADGLHVSQSQVSINNVTISGDGSGIWETGGSSVSLNQVTIENIPCCGFAIQVWGSHMDVNGGIIRNNASGIQVVGGASMNLNQGVLIENNQSAGVLMQGHATLVIGQATIQSNRFEGIWAQDGSSILLGWAGNPVTIQNNGGGGITLSDTSVLRANSSESAVIQGNVWGGISCQSATGAPAAQIEGPTGNPSSGFVVSGNGGTQIGCPKDFNP